MLFGASISAVIAAWMLVNRTSWAGPLLANALRRVVGIEHVARLEEFSYGLQDRLNRWRHQNDPPKARWATPPPTPQVSDAPEESGLREVFHPKSVGPFTRKWFAPGDGEWVPIADPRHPNEPPLLFKTLIHPDINRSWAELFVVVASLDNTLLHLRPGTMEPKADPSATAPSRTGRVDPEDLPQLLAAFNGGFMAEHGHYGMRLKGVDLLKARAGSCTVIGFTNGAVQIATWEAVQDSASRMDWFRQTPPCMYENNVMHDGLRQSTTRRWGATLDGDTVIRRSAIGLDESRRILFVGISNNTTARALAEGMHHAGAVDVAQLDVNWSYPKFLIYKENDQKELIAQAPMDGFEFAPGEYVSKSNLRDFFYLTRRVSCPNCPKSK